MTHHMIKISFYHLFRIIQAFVIWEDFSRDAGWYTPTGFPRLYRVLLTPIFIFQFCLFQLLKFLTGLPRQLGWRTLPISLSLLSFPEHSLLRARDCTRYAWLYFTFPMMEIRSSQNRDRCRRFNLVHSPSFRTTSQSAAYFFIVWLWLFTHITFNSSLPPVYLTL